MERTAIYHDDHLKLEFVKPGHYLHETWWGATPGQTFEKLLEIIVKALNENKAKGLLLDAREHKGLGPESQKLAAHRISEYAKSAGGLKEAIIVPADVFSQFSVENYAKKVGEEQIVNTQFFKDLESAEAWLQE